MNRIWLTILLHVLCEVYAGHAPMFQTDDTHWPGCNNPALPANPGCPVGTFFRPSNNAFVQGCYVNNKSWCSGLFDASSNICTRSSACSNPLDKLVECGSQRPGGNCVNRLATVSQLTSQAGGYGYFQCGTCKPCQYNFTATPGTYIDGPIGTNCLGGNRTSDTSTMTIVKNCGNLSYLNYSCPNGSYINGTTCDGHGFNDSQTCAPIANSTNSSSPEEARGFPRVRVVEANLTCRRIVNLLRSLDFTNVADYEVERVTELTLEGRSGFYSYTTKELVKLLHNKNCIYNLIKDDTKREAYKEVA